ncbi:hypothetical protein [Weissella bombi]|uniref:hypothetical protein n=1 Tax=Weissella bombi TaxID=1505725 RepID=UPI000B84A2B8|nr:hypothetical protein [Weissella bombi]
MKNIYQIRLIIKTFLLDINAAMLRPVRQHVPWGIFPKGDNIWNTFKNIAVSNQVSQSDKKLIEERFKYLEEFKPDIE